MDPPEAGGLREVRQNWQDARGRMGWAVRHVEVSRRAKAQEVLNIHVARVVQPAFTTTEKKDAS